VNPFIQRCSLHGKEVQATDLCGQFTPKRKSEENDDPLAKLMKSKIDY
jgi:hypothetical protein